jgi:hypothetical protein
MKTIDCTIQKELEKDTPIRLNGEDTYLSVKLKLCNYIYSNMSADEIKNEQLYIKTKKQPFPHNLMPYAINLLSVIIPIISIIASVGIACFTLIVSTVEKNKSTVIDLLNNIRKNVSDNLISVMVLLLLFLIVLYLVDKENREDCEKIEKYYNFKLECLKQVLNVKLEELNNPKQKTDYNHKHFKVKVSSIK